MSEVDKKFLARYWGLAGMEREREPMLGAYILDNMLAFKHWEPLSRLVEEGLIYEPDMPENRRRKREDRKLYALTEKGKKWLEENRDKYNSMFIEYCKQEALKILDRFKQFAWRNIDEVLREWEVEQALTGSMGEYMLLSLRRGNDREVLLLRNIDGYNYMIRTFDIDITEEVKSWSQRFDSSSSSGGDSDE
ncbi:hypothetical protein [Thermococcus sp.]|uniref:hypothetical protein n=1 Tax=Thermococcus sp. TaxID=35749 RepID=UPI00261901B4|nr:hypothetical protein [Thermococcus sp.]